MTAVSRLLIAVSLAGVLSIGTAPGAMGAQPSSSPSPHAPTAGIPAEYDALVSFWEQNHVPKAKQKQLFATLEAGGTWDSMEGGSANLVSTHTSKQDGMKVTKYTYKDGSIRVDAVDIPITSSSDGGITPQSVTKCSYSGGSYWYSYTDCKAMSSVGIASLWFYFDYSGSYSSSSINKYYDIGCSVLAGTCSHRHFTKISSRNVRALADFFQAGSTNTIGVGVKVSGPNASTYNL